MTTTRFKTAIRAASQYERRRWMADGAMRIAGILLLALALLVGFGCAQQHEGLVVERMPSSTGYAQPTSSHGANSFAYHDSSSAAHELVEPAPNHQHEALVVEADDHGHTHDYWEASGSGGATHTVVRGDTLFGLAREYYGDAAKWRLIAEANGLTRESTIYAGQQLAIPAADGSGMTAPMSTVGNSQGSPRVSSSGPIGQAETAIAAGRLRDARAILSAALYDLDRGQEPRALNMLAELNMQLLGDTGPDGDCLLHTVERGESLYRIARQHNCTWQSIAKLNRLSDTRILPGQQLLVLKGTPSLVLNRSRGTLDLWLDDHFIKRYVVSVGSRSAVPTGKFRVRSKHDAPASAYGSRAIELNTASVRLHAGDEGRGGVAMKQSDIEELFDIVLHGTEIEVR